MTNTSKDIKKEFENITGNFQTKVSEIPCQYIAKNHNTEFAANSFFCTEGYITLVVFRMIVCTKQADMRKIVLTSVNV